MENASKALLIAAGILIVILLVAFGVKIFSSGGDTAEQAQGVGDSIALAGKDATDKLGAIFDKIGGASGSTVINHNGIVPEGGEYKSGGKKYVPGDKMPAPQDGDIYFYGDYKYEYSGVYSYWNVTAKNKNQNKYGEILHNINGKAIGGMVNTFRNCSNLTDAPEIPVTVIDLTQTFNGCTNLKGMPIIPDGVIKMNYTFQNCTNMRKVTDIPDSVLAMAFCFKGCSAIESITIPKNVNSIPETFSGCSSLKNITIEQAYKPSLLGPSGLTQNQKNYVVWKP